MNERLPHRFGCNDMSDAFQSKKKPVTNWLDMFIIHNTALNPPIVVVHKDPSKLRDTDPRRWARSHINRLGFV